MKTYSKKSNAVRAAIAGIAKSEGMTKEEVKAQAADLFVVHQNDEGFYWQMVAPQAKPRTEHKPAPKPKPKKAPAKRKPKPAAQPAPTPAPKPEPKPTPAPAPEPAPAPQPDPVPVEPPKPEPQTPPPFFNEFSSAANPCKLVWAIADSTVGMRRKDVIQACVDVGVAFHTAKTQYQKWYTARKKANQ